MPELLEVAQAQFDGAVVIQDDVGYIFDALVAGDGDGGQNGRLFHGRVDGDEAFDAASQQHFRIGLQEPSVVTMRDSEEEVVFLAEKGLNSIDDHAAVGIADFFGDNANREGSLHAQGSRQKIRAVVEFAGGGQDPFTGVLGDGSSCGRVVEDGRDRAGCKPEVSGDSLESDRIPGLFGM